MRRVSACPACGRPDFAYVVRAGDDEREEDAEKRSVRDQVRGGLQLQVADEEREARRQQADANAAGEAAAGGREEENREQDERQGVEAEEDRREVDARDL